MLPTEAPQGRKGPQGTGIWKPTQSKEHQLYGVLQQRKQVKQIINRTNDRLIVCSVSQKYINISMKELQGNLQCNITQLFLLEHKKKLLLLLLSCKHCSQYIVTLIKTSHIFTSMKSCGFGSELIFLKPQVFGFRPF